VPDLRAALNEALEDDRGIVVDLSKAEFIDSSVIQALYDTQRDLAVRGRELATEVNTASVVRRVLQITEFRAAVATVGTRDDAVAIARARGAPAAPEPSAAFGASGWSSVAAVNGTGPSSSAQSTG